MTARQPVPLPPQRLRSAGVNFRRDRDFLQAAARDVARLKRFAGLSRDSRVLDWGCGAGRLAMGIKRELGSVAHYYGVDVQPEHVAWANENLADTSTEFVLVDAQNARYNPDGRQGTAIPVPASSLDIVYAYSVFSHMLGQDVQRYLKDLAERLQSGGRMVLTAFVEEGVALVTENPHWYGPLEWEGPLHCVLYNRAFFEGMLADAGLFVLLFEYGKETDGQSLYVLERRKQETLPDQG